MKSKIITFVNWGVLIVIVLFVVWMALGFRQSEDNKKGDPLSFSKECIDVKKIDKFEYDACYDDSSKTIFLKVTRKKENYKINKLVISYVDNTLQSYDLSSVPGAREEKIYKFLVSKNSKSMDIFLDVADIPSTSLCLKRSVFVKDCPTGVSENSSGVFIDGASGVENESSVEVVDFINTDNGVGMDLIDKEKTWKSICKSNWDCEQWEDCIDGIKRRRCRDLNNCFVSTDLPISVKKCHKRCSENWECAWSDCKNGISIPKCKDLNNCGTSLDKPKRLFCEERESCVPDVVCEGWGECEVDYNFFNLPKDKMVSFNGKRSRICIDKKECISPVREIMSCSISVDIYTKKIKKCGKNYVGVYDLLENKMLAILGKDGEKKSLNVYFGDKEGMYCDYCFDGIKNGDEEGVDCGGSCRKCKKRTLIEKSWLVSFLRSFGF